MGRIKAKQIVLKADNVRAVVTNDRKVCHKDPATNVMLPQTEWQPLGFMAEKLMELLDEGDRLNQSNGLYFALTKKLLESFCFLRMSEEYANSESKNISKDHEEQISEFEPRYYTAYDAEDMVDIVETILFTRSASRKMLKYFGELDKLDRAAAAVRLVATAITALRESKVEDWMLQADILEMAYCTPENKGIKEDLIAESLGLNRGTYFNLKRSAISNVSRLLFGSIPNERGFVDTEDPECLAAIEKIIGRKKMQEIMEDADAELAKILGLE